MENELLAQAQQIKAGLIAAAMRTSRNNALARYLQGQK